MPLPPPTTEGESSRYVIPVLAEQAVVTSAVEETGRVRVHSRVVEEQVSLPGIDKLEEVEVTRVPMGTSVDGPLPIRTEGDTTIIPVVEEIAVIERRFILREEVHLTRKRIEQPRTLQTVVRREVITTERLSPGHGLEQSELQSTKEGAQT